MFLEKMFTHARADIFEGFQVRTVIGDQCAHHYDAVLRANVTFLEIKAKHFGFSFYVSHFSVHDFLSLVRRVPSGSGLVYWLLRGV